MEKRLLKKLISMLTLIVILTADFSLLGSNLISYAASNAVTQNIEFSAYFKNETGEKVETKTASIKEENLKLYAEIAVKNEGYFNGTIELQDSNFKIKDNILSNEIASIEGNKINLKQINAGDTAKIELDIEPVIEETISADMLSKASTLKLTGTYMEQTYKGLNVEDSKNVTLNLKIDESAEAELTTDIVTNKVLSINGVNKRVVQLLINSRLTENQYPIKQTTLKINVPQLSQQGPEEVQVLSLGTKATNGDGEKNITNFENTNGVVTIELKNEPDENNQISWNKNVYDEIVVTFIYSEDVDASEVETTTNSEITVYNSENTYLAKHIKGIENKELNNMITTQAETGNAIYKGQLYVNVKSTEKKNIEYQATTTVQVTNSNIVDKITIHEGPDVFTTANSELAANTKYTKTEINKEKMLAVLGQNGSIQIKNGQVTQTINKDTQANEDGNIVINYENGLNELEITTTKPENVGMLEIKHTKAITENTLTTAQIKTITGLKIVNTVTGTLGENTVVENSTETILELKETMTKAELTVNKENLSTMIANNELNLGIELITDDVQYDLYKNAKIEIKLPSSVESISLNDSNELNAEGFTIDAKYNPNTKTIILTLAGEQTEYTTKATQIYLQLNLNVKLSRLAPSKTDKIVMTYTNENASQYDGGTTDAGIIEKEIGISSQNGLVALFGNNMMTDEDTIYGTENIVQNLKNSDSGKNIKFNIDLINNTGSKMSDVKIFGKLPTTGNVVTGEQASNTLTTALKNVTAPNATVYYTENADATTDVSNGWTTNLSSLNNPKLFMIIISELDVESNYSAEYTVQLPNTLEKDRSSLTEYSVIYDTTQEKNAITKSRKIELVTPTTVNMETNITAEVGNDKLNNGDTVKSGEVIKYTATVKNTGTNTLENVKLTAGVPTGTVVVVPEENYEYSGVSYYVELPNVTEKVETISSLAVGETYTINYEVRVKQDIITGTQISNKAITTCEETTIESTELTNKLEEAKIRVTVKRMTNPNLSLLPNQSYEFLAFVENLSTEPVKNLEIKLINGDLKIINIANSDIGLDIFEIPEKLTIDEIPANGSIYFAVRAKVKENVESMSTNAIVTDSEGKMYRSNKISEGIAKTDAKITLTSPQNKQYIQQGELVEYQIIVKNTGEITETIQVADEISEYLEVQALYINGECKFQTTNKNQKESYTKYISNKIAYYLNVPKGENGEIKIVAKVKDIKENFDIKTITNKAEAKLQGETLDISEEVTHTLKGISIEAVKNIVSGTAWLDSNMNGQKDSEEKVLSEIKIRLYNTETNDYVKDSSGNIIETTTDENGIYTFTRIQNGIYIVLFEYDTTKYEPTTYEKEGVDTAVNSKVIFKNITINGEEKAYAVTDIIKLEDNISNLNIGLKEKLTYDLELNKYISRVTVQTKKGTKTYECGDSTLEKIEIHPKEINGAVVVLEYTIKVKNTGDIAGYVNNIVDYIPSGLTFSSELNSNWYLSNNNLHTKALQNEKINPGEEKEIKLILTKTMTETSTGLINNRAEIYENYNEYGIADIDSIPNNEKKDEDDLGVADVIIGPSTGSTTIWYVILMMINIGLIFIAVRLMIKNNIIKIKTIKGRR